MLCINAMLDDSGEPEPDPVFGKLDTINPDAEADLAVFPPSPADFVGSGLNTPEGCGKNKVARGKLGAGRGARDRRCFPGISVSRHNCPLVHRIQLSCVLQYPSRRARTNAATCVVFRIIFRAFSSSSETFFKNAQDFFCHVVGFELPGFVFGIGFCFL